MEEVRGAQGPCGFPKGRALLPSAEEGRGGECGRAGVGRAPRAQSPFLGCPLSLCSEPLQVWCGLPSWPSSV